ncbi:MAG: hypothetical protein KGJ13_09210 [Patescibacteria group bacterium]|nr:hypothetical protein [Patescibacteria group bacterium]
MKYPHFALAGSLKSDQAATAPVLLNWHIRNPDDTGATPKHYPQYNKFRLYRITKGVFNRLQNTGFGWQHPVADFITVPLGDTAWPPAVLCTETEHRFAQARKLVTDRGVLVIQWLRGPSNRALGHLRS